MDIDTLDRLAEIKSLLVILRRAVDPDAQSLVAVIEERVRQIMAESNDLDS